MSTTPFPHHYEVGFESGQLVGLSRAPIDVGAPPQFGGTETVWSPEDLLLGAVLTCAKTTFDSYAAHNAIPIFGWTGRATATLDRSPQGPVFTAIRIELDIVTRAAHVERVRDLVHTVERTCIISRALAAPVEITAAVTVAE